jgi:hypothetical protein
MLQDQVEIMDKLVLMRTNITNALKMYAMAIQYNLNITQQDETNQATFDLLIPRIIEQTVTEYNVKKVEQEARRLIKQLK